MFDKRQHKAAAESVAERRAECLAQAGNYILMCRKDGLSLRETARELDTVGIWPPSRHFASGPYTRTKKWSATAVRRMLKLIDRGEHG